jgi:hypothetical protein
MTLYLAVERPSGPAMVRRRSPVQARASASRLPNGHGRLLRAGCQRRTPHLGAEVAVRLGIVEEAPDGGKLAAVDDVWSGFLIPVANAMSSVPASEATVPLTNHRTGPRLGAASHAIDPVVALAVLGPVMRSSLIASLSRTP